MSNPFRRIPSEQLERFRSILPPLPGFQGLTVSFMTLTCGEQILVVVESGSACCAFNGMKKVLGPKEMYNAAVIPGGAEQQWLIRELGTQLRCVSGTENIRAVLSEFLPN